MKSFLQLNDVPRDSEGWLMLVYSFLNMGMGASDVIKGGPGTLIRLD